MYLVDWAGPVIVHSDTGNMYQYESVNDIEEEWNFGCDIEKAEIIEIKDGIAHIWASRLNELAGYYKKDE